MPTTYANPRERALEVMHSKSKVRLRDPNTGAFLHMSGAGTTPSATWAWLGHKHQANTLEQRAKISGDDWPFKPMPRDMLDTKTEFTG